MPSPDPTGLGAAQAIAGLLLLIAPLAIAVVLWRRFEVLEAKAAIALWVLADAALIYGAQHSMSARTPLLSNYYVAAPFVWSGLGAIAATLAGQYLGVSFKNKRTGAFLVVMAAGIFLFRDAHELVASKDLQWREVLARDPANERALTARTERLARGEDEEAIDACLRRKPDACICSTLRAERRVLFTTGRQSARTASAREALGLVEHARCDGHPMEPRARAVRAVALGMLGQTEEAEALVGPDFEKTPRDPRVLYARALVLQQKKDPGALEAAQAASKASAGPGADLLVAMLLIEAGSLEDAKAALKQYLGRYPDDPVAVYDAALVADRLRDYNAAREGYFKALKLDPQQADARYNLTILTLQAGATAEAKSHAEKFARAFPDDPRRFYLLSLVGGQ